MRGKPMAIMTTTLTVTALLAACSSSSGRAKGSHHATTPVSGGTFTIATSSAVGSFNPYTNSQAWDLSYLAYDSLVNLTPTGTVVSGLASKWTSTSTTTTFTLRPDVTCSDGTKLTLAQVATDLKFLDTASSKNQLYGLVTPPSPYTVTTDPAANTITITTSKPYGFIMDSVGIAPIECAAALANPASVNTKSDGTGPFVLTSVVPGNSYTFAVRKGYHWGPGGTATSAAGTPSKVVVRVVTSQTTAANLLLAGQVNAATITGSDAARLTRFSYFKDPITIAAALYNQIGNHPTASEPVRQALTEGLDLKSLVSVSTAGVTGGSAETSWVIIPPAVCAADDTASALPGYDPKAAQALLDRAGWVPGADGVREKDGKKLELTVVYEPASYPTLTATVELMADEWKAIGAKVNLDSVDTTQGSQIVFTSHDFDVYVSGLDAQNPAELVPALSGAIPPNGQNFLGIDNPQYNELTDKASAQTGAAACSTWQQAERTLFQDADTVPISQSAGPTFLNGATAQSNGFAIPIPTSIKLTK